MNEDSDNLEPFLPALDLRNKPDGGKGPLGKKDFCLKDAELVKNLQKMLKTLGYDLGTSGPDKNGVDGAFGDLTENAITDFQEKNRDWDGEQLKDDGLVGPKTSDALNRAMVGKSYESKKWDEHYQTPAGLTSASALLTATAEALKYPVSIKIEHEQKGKVVITTPLPQPKPQVIYRVIYIWLHDHLGQLMGADPSSPDPIAREQGAPYRLSIPDGEIRTGYANPEGCVVEYGFPWNMFWLIQWGKRKESHWQIPPYNKEDADEFYLYSDYIFIGSEPDSGDLVYEQLKNLGYSGTLEQGREAFAADYGSSDDDVIKDVHATGRPKKMA